GDTAVVALFDTGSSVYSFAAGQLSTLFTSTPGTLNGYGAGADTLDGGSGSDHLFGLGGNDVFVFELNDGGAANVDTVWDFNKNSEVDKLKLTQGGTGIDAATRDALLAAQTINGADRSIFFTDGASKQVTIVVKGINRDLIASDFCTSGASDPLVLDLDGNGVELSSVNTHPFGFDMNADGLLDQTGWVSGGDGLLVLDRNANGTIDDIREVVSEYFVPGVKSSLEALITLDENHDNRIDLHDAAFSHLQVLTADGGLHGLDGLGITALTLETQAGWEVIKLAGNTITGMAGFERGVGTAGVMTEVVFSYDAGAPDSTRPGVTTPSRLDESSHPVLDAQDVTHSDIPSPVQEIPLSDNTPDGALQANLEDHFVGWQTSPEETAFERHLTELLENLAQTDPKGLDSQDLFRVMDVQGGSWPGGLVDLMGYDHALSSFPDGTESFLSSMNSVAQGQEWPNSLPYADFSNHGEAVF
ncbi:MAG TPA: hypothetical protein HPQ00_12995, partial [Magnetococcales bacterium]|nr:hypothetical protein [Magnetococcales bacterium]